MFWGFFWKKVEKKVAEIFGWYWFFVVPLQPQTGNRGSAPVERSRAEARLPGGGRLPGLHEDEFIEMIAIDKEQ